MAFPININNQSTKVPKNLGGTFNVTPQNSWDALHALGWRWAEFPPEPAAGYERLTGVTYIQDPNDTDKAIPQYTDTLIQDRLDQEAAEDLVANAEQYTYQNVFLLICDALSGNTDHSKLSLDQLTGLLLPLRTSDPADYGVKRDALSLVNSKLIRFNTLWWDSCEWCADGGIVAQAQALYNQIMG